MSKENKNRLRELYSKLVDNKASKAEEEEYIRMLYQEGKIPDEQYKNYRKNVEVDFVVKLSLIAGAVFVLGMLVDNMVMKRV